MKTCKICKDKVNVYKYVRDDQDGVAVFCDACTDDYGAEVIRDSGDDLIEYRMKKPL